jgi:hypothetical protein
MALYRPPEPMPIVAFWKYSAIEQSRAHRAEAVREVCCCGDCDRFVDCWDSGEESSLVKVGADVEIPAREFGRSYVL